MPSMRRAGITMIATSRPATAPTGNISGQGRSWLMLSQQAGSAATPVTARLASEKMPAVPMISIHIRLIDA